MMPWWWRLAVIWYWLQYGWRGRFPQRRQLERFQQRRWRRFRRHILRRVPYYRSTGFPAELSAYPQLDKNTCLAYFDDLNTVDISRSQAEALALAAEHDRDFSPTWRSITVGLSTGTSGRRGLFLVAPLERAQWTAMVLRRVLHWRPGQRHRVAFFLRANSNLYQSVQSSAIAFTYFDLFKPWEQLLPQLQTLRPTVLAAPPQVLVRLAAAQEQGQIQLEPQLLVSFAEVLWPDERAYAERVFGAPLREVYQCTEGFLGVTCSHGVMHLNEDLFFVEKEYLAPGCFVPILTDFTRRSQPLVRYRLDDILVERSTPCPCGSSWQALERIEGRSDDLLRLSNVEGRETILFPDLICRVIAQATDQFERYSLRQTGATTLELELAAPDFATTGPLMIVALHQLLAQHQVAASIQLVPWPLDRPLSTKHRRVVGWTPQPQT